MSLPLSHRQAGGSRLLVLLDRRWTRFLRAEKEWRATVREPRHLRQGVIPADDADQGLGRSCIVALLNYCYLFRAHRPLAALLETLGRQEEREWAEFLATAAMSGLRAAADHVLDLVEARPALGTQAGLRELDTLLLTRLRDGDETDHKAIFAMFKVAEAAQERGPADKAASLDEMSKMAEATLNAVRRYLRVTAALSPHPGAAAVRQYRVTQELLHPDRQGGQEDRAWEVAYYTSEHLASGNPSMLVVESGWDLPGWEAIVDALRVFHSWVVRRLEEGGSDVELLQRYRRRCVLFEASELRWLAQQARRLHGRNTSADEDALRDRLGVWLHDAGREAVPEAKLDRARADGLLTGRSPIAFEVKLLRESDALGRAAARLETGFTQALAYAQKVDALHGHLIVFDLTGRRVGFPKSASVGDTRVLIHHINIGPAPTKGSRKLAWDFAPHFKTWAKSAEAGLEP